MKKAREKSDLKVLQIEIIHLQKREGIKEINEKIHRVIVRDISNMVTLQREALQNEEMKIY